MDCLHVKLTRRKLLAAAEAGRSSRTSGSGQILDNEALAYHTVPRTDEPLRIAPWQAYRGFTLKTPIWEPHLYIHTRTPADVSPFVLPPSGVFLGVTLLYNLS